MSAELFDRVRQIASDVFNEPMANLSADSSPDNVEGWDSLTHLNFLLALEQSFGCEIQPEEGEEMSNGLTQSVALLEKKLK